MNKKIVNLLPVFALVLFVATILATPALAVTEEEVENQVAAVGKDAVTGNLFIWFLCAIAFLKASQKIDSFMGALGISVGHTGGSMLAEALVVARGAEMVKGVHAGGHSSRSGGGRSSPGGGGTAPGGGKNGGAFSGGLAGMVGRWAATSAARSVTQPCGVGVPVSPTQAPGGGAAATNNGTPGPVGGGTSGARQGPLTPTGQPGSAPAGGSTPVAGAGAPNDDMEQIWNEIEHAHGIGVDVDGLDDVAGVSSDVAPGESGGTSQGEPATAASEHGNQAPSASAAEEPMAATGSGSRSLGRRAFDRSMAQGGAFATRVISSVALGSVGSMGTMTGPTAAAALSSYLGVGGGGVAGGPVPNGGGHVPATSGAGAVPSGEGGSEMAAPLQGGYSLPGDMPIPGESTIPVDRGQPPASEGVGVGGVEAPAPTPAPPPVTFGEVEIGGGRITGIEYSPETPQGAKFAMFSASHYAAPEEEFSTVTAKDGSQWYKQYAQDVVQRKPYKAEDGSIAYHEKLVKKLPKAPPRKERM